MATVLTLEKSLGLLEAVVQAPQGLGTRALAKALGLNVSTVHNIATTFVQYGYLRQDEHTRHFHPGLRLHLLGRAPSCRTPFVAAARRIVQTLSVRLNESAMIVAFEDGHRITNIAFAPSRQALRVQEPEDMGAYAHCTAAGKILLARMSAPQLDEFVASYPLVRHTPSTITSRAALDLELKRTRERDYAQTRDELCEGISAYAVPIRDPWGSVFAAIGASAPSIRLRKADVITATLQGLRSAAAEIEQILARSADSGPGTGKKATPSSCKT
jgi:Transcriptional regulator